MWLLCVLVDNHRAMGLHTALSGTAAGLHVFHPVCMPDGPLHSWEPFVELSIAKAAVAQDIWMCCSVHIVHHAHNMQTARTTHHVFHLEVEFVTVVMQLLICTCMSPYW